MPAGAERSSQCKHQLWVDCTNQENFSGRSQRDHNTKCCQTVSCPCKVYSEMMEINIYLSQRACFSVLVYRCTSEHFHYICSRTVRGIMPQFRSSFYTVTVSFLCTDCLHSLKHIAQALIQHLTWCNWFCHCWEICIWWGPRKPTFCWFTCLVEWFGCSISLISLWPMLH